MKKPKAAIVYLSRSTNKDVENLKRSILYLERCFNARFEYPVIIFHEDFTREIEDYIRQDSKSEIIFQKIEFKIPDFLDKNTIPVEYQLDKDCSVFDIGYRHMCRFFSNRIFHHAALKGFDWIWRLDTDTFILCPISYDVFRLMESGGQFTEEQIDRYVDENKELFEADEEAQIRAELKYLFLNKNITEDYESWIRDADAKIDVKYLLDLDNL